MHLKGHQVVYDYNDYTDYSKYDSHRDLPRVDVDCAAAFMSDSDRFVLKFEVGNTYFMASIFTKVNGWVEIHGFTKKHRSLTEEWFDEANELIRVSLTVLGFDTASMPVWREVFKR